MREDYLSSENQHFNSSQRQGANAWERLRKKNKMEAIEKWESGGGEGVFLGAVLQCSEAHRHRVKIKKKGGLLVV